MDRVTLQLHGSLGQFLRPPVAASFTTPLHPAVTVKHLIESLGIPHTEVEGIQVNQEGVGFDYLVQTGDHIVIYPWDIPLPPGNIPALRPAWPTPPRFIADNHLGRLARLLRLVGLDTLYHPAWEDAELAQVAAGEERILLTRDRALLMRKQVTFGYCLHTRQTDEQLQQVWRRFDLALYAQPWTRCLRCNGRLEPVAKEAIVDRLEPKTRLYYDSFHQCAGCQQVYWPGSHYEHLNTRLRRLLRSSAPATTRREDGDAQPHH